MHILNLVGSKDVLYHIPYAIPFAFSQAQFLSHPDDAFPALSFSLSLSHSTGGQEAAET